MLSFDGNIYKVSGTKRSLIAEWTTLTKQLYVDFIHDGSLVEEVNEVFTASMFIAVDMATKQLKKEASENNDNR